MKFDSIGAHQWTAQRGGPGEDVDGINHQKLGWLLTIARPTLVDFCWFVDVLPSIFGKIEVMQSGFVKVKCFQCQKKGRQSTNDKTTEQTERKGRQRSRSSLS